jgi:hypothetical protein
MTGVRVGVVIVDVAIPAPRYNARAATGHSRWMNGHEPDDGRAPICPYCGVTALPVDPSHVIDVGFVCENPDCEAFGDRIEG